MSSVFSPQIEQKIADALAGGLYPSREALIEAGVEYLLADVPLVPEQHLPLVEAAIESSRAGQSAPMTQQEWNGLHQMVSEIASGKQVPLE